MKKEIKKKIPLTKESKIIKYLGVNLTNEMKDLYIENCRMLTEIKQNRNKWKDACLCIGRVPFNVRMTQSNL